ncbi:hypothetical protein D3C80_1528280 [compost metagenome]
MPSLNSIPTRRPGAWWPRLPAIMAGRWLTPLRSWGFGPRSACRSWCRPIRFRRFAIWAPRCASSAIPRMTPSAKPSVSPPSRAPPCCRRSITPRSLPARAPWAWRFWSNFHRSPRCWCRCRAVACLPAWRWHSRAPTRPSPCTASACVVVRPCTPACSPASRWTCRSCPPWPTPWVAASAWTTSTPIP